MLSRIIPALIIFLVIFSIQATADETLPDNYLMVRPGENISISFQINCHSLDKGYYNGSIDIPVPEIYTYVYSNDTSYCMPTEERTYEYLVCSVYDKVNLSELMETFTIPLNVTFENSSIFYINYIFSPPKGEYDNNTVFFVQNIENKIVYLGNITETETEIDLFWMWLLIIPLVGIAIVSLYQVYDTSRRRRRIRERVHQRNIERLRELRMSLAGYPRTMSPPHYEPRKELMRPPPPPTVFKCRNKNDEMREFIKGDGMFEIGIKKFKVPSFDEQVKMISEMPEIESFNPTTLELVVDLNEYGKYFLKLRNNPTAYRVENDETTSCRNPYIHNGNFGLCLGNGQKLYNRCYENKHYVECIRILCEVLKSKHGKGYRKWSDCGM